MTEKTDGVAVPGHVDQRQCGKHIRVACGARLGRPGPYKPRFGMDESEDQAAQCLFPLGCLRGRCLLGDHVDEDGRKLPLPHRRCVSYRWSFGEETVEERGGGESDKQLVGKDAEPDIVPVGV